MPADFTVAKAIFDFYSDSKPRFAVTWVDHKQQWYVCPSAIMCRTTRAHDSPVSSYNGKPSNEKLKANKEAAYPENFLARDSYALPDQSNEIFTLDTQVVSLATGTVINFDKGRHIPLRHYTMLCPALVENWKSFVNHRLVFHKLQSVPMLAVDFIGGTLWVGYYQVEKPEDIKIETTAGIIKPDCWSDTERCYTKIRKENTMLEPSKFMNDILKSSLKFDPEKPGKENDGTTGVTINEALKEPAKPVKAEVKDNKKTATEKVVEEARVEAKKAVAELNKGVEAPAKKPAAIDMEIIDVTPKEITEEPKKPARKKTETTPVNDLTKIIDQLSGAVPENLSSDTVQTALRQLRDLQLAASRRAANIALQYVKDTEGAVAKLAAIKATL